VSENLPKAAFITFYSFKGGVGRSMALINTAGMLAGRGFRVLVIDLDLEAPGLSYLDPDEPTAPATLDYAPKTGFVELLSDAKRRGEGADLFVLPAPQLVERYCRPYRLPAAINGRKSGVLSIMPAGKLDVGYSSRFDSLNLRQLYEEKVGEPLIRAFKKKFAEAGLFDYVLVDSRTGFSDEAGICTRDLADYLMVLTGLNRQNIEGTCAFLRAFRVATEGKHPGFQIILSPVPLGEDALVDERESMAARAFEKAWGSKLDLTLEIPYHPQLALTEAPHIFRRRRGHLFEAYSAIEDRMLKAIGHDAQTLRGEIETGLKGRDYSGVLHNLKRLIRVNGGEAAVSHLALRWATEKRPSVKGKEGVDLGNDEASIERILGEKTGRAVAEFFVDHVSVDDGAWEAKELLQRMMRIRDFDLADRLFKRVTAITDSDPEVLGNYAVFLETQRSDKDGAEACYRRAIEADPEDSVNLANYADFLQKQRGDKDGAQAHFLRAIDTDPKNSSILGRYAVFLDTERGDKDGAEVYFIRCIDADPKNANNLGNYAIFLSNRRGHKDGAGVYFLKAIEADPKNANNLGNYALFLASEREDKDGAEAYYLRAIEADPEDATNLGSYAVFLANERGDKDGAEAYHLRAIEADPKNARNLGNYAVFLANERGDKDGAEAYYLRAIEADPKNARNLDNYAFFL
jgi:Tfp pilus assembly protein PilF